MSGEAATETATSSEHGPRRRTWIYAAIVALVAVVFGYLSLIQYEDSLANRDYYRVLYEAAETFNENLDQLDRRYRYGQSPSAIKSVLPSYTVVNGGTCSPAVSKFRDDRAYRYQLNAQPAMAAMWICNYPTANIAFLSFLLS